MIGIDSELASGQQLGRRDASHTQRVKPAPQRTLEDAGEKREYQG
jgi:hypothetical protein